MMAKMTCDKNKTTKTTFSNEIRKPHLENAIYQITEQVALKDGSKTVYQQNQLAK